ncbi:MAG: RuvX/YqgF family protein [Patescibacteria group bacterium]
MKYLGVDYGSKRIGLATSTPDGAMAFPHSVVEVKGRTAALIAHQIANICAMEEVEAVIVGESKNYQGKDNVIMASAKDFINEFSKISKIPVDTYPEFMTSHQAAALQGENSMLDASAAAIILQSYLDAHKLS